MEHYEDDKMTHQKIKLLEWAFALVHQTLVDHTHGFILNTEGDLVVDLILSIQGWIHGWLSYRPWPSFHISFGVFICKVGIASSYSVSPGREGLSLQSSQFSQHLKISIFSDL